MFSCLKVVQPNTGLKSYIYIFAIHFTFTFCNIVFFDFNKFLNLNLLPIQSDPSEDFPISTHYSFLLLFISSVLTIENLLTTIPGFLKKNKVNFCLLYKCSTWIAWLANIIRIIPSADQFDTSGGWVGGTWAWFQQI